VNFDSFFAINRSEDLHAQANDQCEQR